MAGALHPAPGVWFYAVVSILLAAVVWLAIHRNVYMAFAAVVGSTVFFITHGFRQNAELAERRMMTSGIAMADLSKLLYLEAIDASFSIDGVLGAFAFTLSVPLILAGNGLGALVLRWVTVANIERIKRYRLLKNGAMYSIAILGSIMLLDAFGVHVPSWLAPVSTLGVIGYFLRRAIKQARLSSALPETTVTDATGAAAVDVAGVTAVVTGTRIPQQTRAFDARHQDREQRASASAISSTDGTPRSLPSSLYRRQQSSPSGAAPATSAPATRIVGEP